MGTLIAIYLSTSDEMIPVMISEKAPVSFIIKVLALKMVIGIAAGIAVDLLLKRQAGEKRKIQEEKIHCCENGIFASAVHHTIQIAAFIFLISLALNSIIHFIGEEQISQLLLNRPVIGELLAGLVGLIPNCASSVVITQLYLEGMISFGAMMSGVLVGAGIGLAILFRLNTDKKECLKIVGILYAVGVTAGILLEFLPSFF